MPSVRMELRRLGRSRKGRGVIILFVRISGVVWLDGKILDCCWVEGGLRTRAALGAVKGGF